MGKKSSSGQHGKPSMAQMMMCADGTKRHCPFVSVCTPTFNRRPFIPMMLECFRQQTYPKSRVEWIIIDDGTDPIKDVLEEHGKDLMPFIKYFYYPEKMTLGKKRNLMHEKTKGSIIVYFDDDDFLPPRRIAHAVEKLQENPKALCAGSSEMYIYFKHIQKMYQFGPYGPNHSTAGTFAFRRELLNITRYEDEASLAEEKFFLKDYTIPFVQLDPLQTILVFSHEHNTFDKRRLLENPHPQFVRESTKTVDDFVKDGKIKKFFLEEINGLLEKYAPGEPQNKPDVLKQLKKIEEERKRGEEEHRRLQQQKQGQSTQQPAPNSPVFLMKGPDGSEKAISPEEVVQLIDRQQKQIAEMSKVIQDQQASLQSNMKKINDISVFLAQKGLSMDDATL